MLINTSTASNNPALGVLNNIKLPVSQPNTNNNPIEKNTQSPVAHSQYRADLKKKILISQKEIRNHIALNNAKIIHRTNARNCKSQSATISDEQATREAMMAEQIRAWRKILPSLIRKFSRIPDPRRTKSIKHKLVVLMIFGLFAFVFRLSSRREMNRELTGATVNHNLKKIFPELDSTPHADTLARMLEKTNPKEIEGAHIELIKDLIKNKKFKKLLINDCLPISVDGAQKLFRDGLLHDSHWLQRTVGKNETHAGEPQQYVYTIEANITLKNGLNIPLLTQYLTMQNNLLMNPDTKQDCELNAFERLSDKLKRYFPRQKIILFMDALYATQGVMGIAHKNKWEYVINLPKNKLTDFAILLNKKRKTKISIPSQPYYRERKQEFYWVNNIEYGYDFELRINLIACQEMREEINTLTGEIEKKYSEHVWISSIPMSIERAHEICNLGARNKGFIEDNMNTEKHRGYHYTHSYSYNWNAMQCFHILMRLGHAINALSEFTKKLKKYVKENGCGAMLKFIKDIIFNPWLPNYFYKNQNNRIPQLRLQLE